MLEQVGRHKGKQQLEKLKSGPSMQSVWSLTINIGEVQRQMFHQKKASGKAPRRPDGKKLSEKLKQQNRNLKV